MALYGIVSHCIAFVLRCIAVVSHCTALYRIASHIITLCRQAYYGKGALGTGFLPGLLNQTLVWYELVPVIPKITHLREKARWILRLANNLNLGIVVHNIWQEEKNEWRSFFFFRGCRWLFPWFWEFSSISTRSISQGSKKIQRKVNH